MSLCNVRWLNENKTIFQFVKYLKPFTSKICLATIVLILSQLLMLVPPYLTKILIDTVFNRTGAQNNIEINEMINMLGIIVFALFLTKIISIIVNVFKTYISIGIGNKIVHNIRIDLYRQLHFLKLSFFDRRDSGAIFSRIIEDINALQEFLSNEGQQMISNTIILLFAIIFLFQQNYKLAIWTIIPMPITILCSIFILKKYSFLYGDVWGKWSSLYTIISEFIQGIRVVKAFAQEKKSIQNFEKTSLELCDASAKAEQVMGVICPVMWFMMSLGQILVWYIGGLEIINNEITIGTLVMFIAYSNILYGPAQELTGMFNRATRCFTAAERIFEIMNTEREEVMVENKIVLSNLKGHVKFNNVTFGYDENYPVLHDINFEANPGELVGLIGCSGAGKTTIVNLICRFYNVQKGSIYIDGNEIKNIKLRDLRSNIGIVSQESYLFTGSIKENISYSKENINMEEIILAAKVANAHEFIISFPDGYDTKVGEGGRQLSGGEIQRIAIARAVIANPRILILDEATSSVDSITEEKIRQAIIRLSKNRTTFAIAHKIKTLRNADKLLVFDKGKIIENGTHEDLIRKDGVYKKIFDMQNDKFVI